MKPTQSPDAIRERAPTPNYREDNLMGKASRFLFGNDVFISYARRDSTIYSLGLANELTKNELSCFLDQWGTPSGKELPTQLVTALKRSNMLILLGTKQAAASLAVATEIREFKKTGRTIIPVSFDGALEQAEWYKDLIAGISIAQESSETLSTGKPSEHVVSRIVNAENFTRRSKRLRRYFGITAASVVTMLAAAGLVAMFIVRQANAKVRDAEVRFQEADARAGEALARAAEAETNRQQAQAEASRLTGVAQQAQDQQKVAEQKANAAAESEAIAKSNADEQRKIADEQEQRNRRLVYIGNIQLAQQMVETGRIGKVQKLLDVFRPELATAGNKPREDLRGYEWYHLWHASHSKLADIPLTGEESDSTPYLNRIAVAPLHKQFATAGWNGLKVWSASTVSNASSATSALPIATLHEGNLESVEYSPDQSILATLDGSKILLWNAETRAALKPIEAPAGKFYSIAFVPSHNSRLAAADARGVNIWDITPDGISVATKPTPKPVPWPREIGEGFPYFAFSPDGTCLAVESGGVIEVWEIPANGGAATMVATLEQTSDQSHMLFLANNQTVAILFQDEKDFKLWDLRSKTIKSEFKIDIGTGASINEPTTVTAVLSGDGKVLATGAKYRSEKYGGGVKLWNAFTGKLLTTFEGLGTDGGVAALAFSFDGKTLAIGTDDQVQLSDSTLGGASIELQSPVEHISVSADGTLLASVRGRRDENSIKREDWTLDFWNTSTGKLDNSHTKKAVNYITFSPDGTKYATSTFIQGGKSEKWLVELWDARSHVPSQLGEAFSAELLFSPDGKTLAAAGFYCQGSCVQFWDITSDAVGRKESPPPPKWWLASSAGDAAIPMAYSPDGKLLVARGGGDSNVSLDILDVSTNKSLVRFNIGSQSSYNSCAFSPDGKTLAIALGDSTISLWDISSVYGRKSSASPAKEFESWDANRSEHLLDVLEGHTAAVTSVAYSPDGKTIASASKDGTVKLWDARFYIPLATFSDYQGPVKFMLFTPDGRALVTADESTSGKVTSVRLRRAATKEEVALRSK